MHEHYFFLDSASQPDMYLSDAFIGIVVVSTVLIVITITLSVMVIVLCLKRNNIHKKSDNYGNPQIIYEDIQDVTNHPSGKIGIEKNEAYISASNGQHL